MFELKFEKKLNFIFILQGFYKEIWQRFFKNWFIKVDLYLDKAIFINQSSCIFFLWGRFIYSYCLSIALSYFWMEELLI